MKKILSIVLAFALFLVPVTTVRAVSLRDVMDQVTSLKTEVAQLKSVVNGKVLGATTTTVISRTLAPGLKNDPEVLKLQVWLNQKGYLAVTPDGNYGPQTTEGVKRFQAANKLTATGTVDYQTMTAINQTVANTPPVLGEITIELLEESIANSQIKNISQRAPLDDVGVYVAFMGPGGSTGCYAVYTGGGSIGSGTTIMINNNNGTYTMSCLINGVAWKSYNPH